MFNHPVFREEFKKIAPIVAPLAFAYSVELAMSVRLAIGSFFTASILLWRLNKKSLLATAQ